MAVVLAVAMAVSFFTNSVAVALTAIVDVSSSTVVMFSAALVSTEARVVVTLAGRVTVAVGTAVDAAAIVVWLSLKQQSLYQSPDQQSSLQ